MNEHSAAGHAPGLWPVPGDGVLARKGGLVLLSSLDDSQAVDTLLDLLEQLAASGGDGRQFADAVADAIETGMTDEEAQSPSLLAFGPTKTGLAVTVSGGAWADVTTAHGTTRIEAGHPGMLMRCVLRTPATAIEGGLSHADNGAARTDRFSRLDAGTVRASGLAFFVAGAPQPQGGPAGKPASLAKGRSGRAASRDQPAAAAAPAAAPAAAEPASAAEVPAVEVPAVEEPAPGEAAAAVPAGGGPAAAEPAAAGLMPDAEHAAPSRHEPTAAWIPPADAQARATEQWSPDWSGDWEAGQEPAAAGLAAEPAAEPAGAPPEAGTPDVTIPPQPQPSEFGEPFEAVLLHGPGVSAEAPARGPLSLARDVPPGSSSYASQGPVIQGVYCANGHFDDPEALFCAICGISMNQQTLVPRPGERPPLGVLLLDDGSVFQLDGDYVVGREPSLDASVAEGRARALRVTDENGIVSRVHARVHLEGWRVLVTDLGSANGTRVQLPAQPGEQQLVPQVPVVLGAGSQVDLGGRMFRYESHRGR